MRDKFVKWLRAFRPPFAVSVIGAVFFSGMSICFVATDWFAQMPIVCSYIVYACAAVFLAFGIWAVTLLLMKMSIKQYLLEAAGRYEFTEKLTVDYRYRTLILSACSLVFNVIFSISKMAAGWYYSSVWLMVLAGYYLILCISKVMLLRFGRALTRLNDQSEVLMHEWKAYRLCGIMQLVMMVFLQGVVIMIVRDGTGFSYNEIVVIAIAAYDFYCLGNAIFYMVRRRKKHSPIVNSLKMISMAASLVAILSLQTAMFSSFSVESEAGFKTVMNVLTGTAVCLFLIIQGIVAIRKANMELKRYH